MSSNIFEIWDKIGRQTPFAVRRDNWGEEYYTIVEKIECDKMPYGKAYGFATVNGEYSDHYEYDKKWREEKLIPCCGCYQWTLVENLGTSLGKPIIETANSRVNDCPYSLDSKFKFGKYKDISIKTVFQDNPQYIAWALVNVDKFCLTSQAISELESLASAFEFNPGLKKLNEDKLLKIRHT